MYICDLFLLNIYIGDLFRQIYNVICPITDTFITPFIQLNIPLSAVLHVHAAVHVSVFIAQCELISVFMFY